MSRPIITGMLERSLVVSLALTCSCGSGVFAIASLGSGDDGGTPATIGGLEVFSTRTSPVAIRFVLRDAESDRVDVRIFAQGDDAQLVGGSYHEDLEDTCAPSCDLTYDCTTGAAKPATPDMTQLKTSPNGVVHTRLWDFDADGIGPERVPGILIRVEIEGGPSVSTQVDLGNDPPQLEPIDVSGFPDPLSGIAFVPITVCDSSEDELFIRIEYMNLSGGSCDWILSRPAQTPEGEETPCFPVDTDALSCPDGGEEDYFWQTAWEELAHPDCDLRGVVDAQVVLRITALESLRNEDDTPLCTQIVTDPFTVTNLDPEAGPGSGHAGGATTLVRAEPDAGRTGPARAFGSWNARSRARVRRLASPHVNRLAAAPHSIQTATNEDLVALLADVDLDGIYDWWCPNPLGALGSGCGPWFVLDPPIPESSALEEISFDEPWTVMDLASVMGIALDRAHPDVRTPNPAVRSDHSISKTSTLPVPSSALK